MKPYLCLLSAMLVAIACDTAKHSTKGGTGTDTSSGGIEKDDAPGPAPDVADESDGGCKDLRHPGDGLQPGDDCWDPPLHYCSEGLGAGGQVACAPDGSLCCLLHAYCYPCGWESCIPLEDVGCPSIRYAHEQPEECLQHGGSRVNIETEICWDDVVPSR